MRLLLTTLFAFGLLAGRTQSLYFPPNGSNTWETTDPATLGWCPERIDSLYAFLGSRNTKAFIVLKDGRIVLEHYFGTFTQDSLWYWASAGKTLTSTLTGIAQEEGYLDIEQPASTYLGTGWTSAPPDKEALITVRNQLTMTSGLDDGVADSDCTDPACLTYLADAGTRWAYHNAAYTILDQVIANSTGQTFNAYFNTRIRNPIGMDGLWWPVGYNNVYFSKARSMARYGLLALNNMVWGADTVLHDAAYFNAATTPSQTLNDSYGYLWWLNGQPSFMVPGVQFVFPGSLLPDAPNDMFSALGKNDQYLNVVPSRNMVVVRMGDQAYTDALVPLTLDDEIWQHIEWLDCGTGLPETSHSGQLRVAPNPCADYAIVSLATGTSTSSLDVFDATGKHVMSVGPDGRINASMLAPGPYSVKTVTRSGVFSTRFIKL
jgi:CubicO group peptidase (beta-lactamase class C family)